jgi:hypothetical protein
MSDCNACIYTSFDGDLPEFHSERILKARKPHRCIECGETIAPGERYQRDILKHDGAISSFKTCLACTEIREAFCCEGWIYGQLWQDARDSLFEGLTTGCLEKLTTAAAKEKLVAEWNDWKFDR